MIDIICRKPRCQSLLIPELSLLAVLVGQSLVRLTVIAANGSRDVDTKAMSQIRAPNRNQDIGFRLGKQDREPFQREADWRDI